MSATNHYVRYYLDQQRGGGFPVFKGSRWQNGFGQQIGFGLGGLFRNIARVAMPLVKDGAKALGKIALNSGTNFLCDVIQGKNAKEAAKSRFHQAKSVAGQKAVNKLKTLTQTGSGRRGMTNPRKKRLKKRKASTKPVTFKRAKKRKTVHVEDIFG